VFKGSGVLRLVADDSSPQGGSVLGAVYAQRSEPCAFFCGFGKLAYRFRSVFSHNGLLTNKYNFLDLRWKGFIRGEHYEKAICICND
jgi:hypothetical protein